MDNKNRVTNFSYLYNTFRYCENYDLVGERYVNREGCIAFVHDMCKGIPSEYDKCDILYSELSWLKGYPIFKDRAGIKDNYSFNDYVLSIASIIESTIIPIVFICGKSHLKRFPKYTSMLPVSLNDHSEFAYSWGLDISGMDTRDNVGLISNLSDRYECVGDFCCGFGLSGRIFRSNGKSFIMSDINEKCITYISSFL
jgi:hypothetical protein